MGYFFAALAGGVLFFNSQASPKRVARGMEDALRAKLPTMQVRVEVEGKRGLNVVNGKFKAIRVQISGKPQDARIIPVVETPKAETPKAETPKAETPKVGMAKTVKNADDKSGSFAISAVAKAKKAGRIGQFSLQMRDFDIEGVRVESADLTWNDLVYDWSALRKDSQLNLVAAGTANVRAVVGVEVLQKLLAEKTNEIQDAKLSLKNGRVIISGTRAAPFFGTPLPVVVSARPEIRGGTEIWLADMQASFSGAALPTPLVNQMAEKLNPVYKFALGDKWPFTLNIQRINAQNEKLEVFAALTFIPVTPTAPVTATVPVPKTAPQIAPIANGSLAPQTS